MNPDSRGGSPRSFLALWVMVLALPAVTIMLIIGLGIFGLLVRLFNA
ncbi:hypothetical protein [Paraburkholderia silvatlantica]